MALQAADGSYNITVVNGASLTGLKANDGSFNVVVVPGTSVTGLQHSCGAYNVIVDDETRMHSSGALSISEDLVTQAMPVKVVSGSIPVQATRVNGSTPVWLTNNALEAGTDNSKYTFSFWFKVATWPVAAAAPIWILDPESIAVTGFYLGTVGADKVMYTETADDTYTDVLSVISEVPNANNTWHHVIVSAQTDLAAGNKIMQVYIDDVDASGLTAYTKTDAGASFTPTIDNLPFRIGGSTAYVLSSFDVDLAELWFAPGQQIDLSVETNRRKFISATAKPIYLGSKGEVPTGTAPAVFLRGGEASFASNRGTGGSFYTTGGDLVDASSTPRS